MKTKKYSVMAIAMVASNIAVMISGIFFIPELSDDMLRGVVLMGIAVTISIILLIAGLCRKEFNGAAKSLLLLSYIIAGLVFFRWFVTIFFIFIDGGPMNGAWGSLSI